MDGHIEDRGNGSWRIKIYLGEDARGKKRYTSRTVRGTKREAQKVRTEMLHQLNLKEFVEPSKLTLEGWAGEWLATCAQGGVRPTTLPSYQAAMRRVCADLGSKRLSDVTPRHLQAWQTKLLGEGLTARYVHRTMTVVSVALESAVKLGALQRNPAKAVQRPRVTARPMSIWTPEQLRHFLAVAQTDPHYAWYATAAHTGMRFAELLGLRWEDVEFDSGLLRVKRTRSRDGGYAPPKSAAGVRAIAMPEDLSRALAAHRRQQAANRLRFGADYGDPGVVFATEDGNPIAGGTLRNGGFRRLTARAGLPRIRFHDLRHSHATLLLSAGVNAKVVSERLGHSSIQVTLDVYSHVLPQMQEQAASILQTLLATPSGQ